MKSYLFILSIAVFLSTTLYGQKIDSNCPNLKLDDVPIAVSPGEGLVFSLVNKTSSDKVNLEFIWTVNRGKIVGGQGTKTIKVSTLGLENTTVTASVKVNSITSRCTKLYSAAGMVNAVLPHEYYDVFEDIDDESIMARLDSYLAGLQENSNYIGYIESYGPSFQVTRREKLVVGYLKYRKIDLNRVFFVRGGFEKSIRTRLWFFLEKIKMPGCEDCEIVSANDVDPDKNKDKSRNVILRCPTIVVEDSALPVRTGENIRFSVKVDSKTASENLEYEWSVDKGTIVEGQGAAAITVSTNEVDGDTVLTASVTVKGLPKECVNSDSGKVIVSRGGHPIFSDEFGKIPRRDIEARLKVFLNDLKENSEGMGFIVSYGKKSSILKRENIFRRIIEKRKLNHLEIVFIDGGQESQIRTRLWIVPSGTDPSLVN